MDRMRGIGGAVGLVLLLGAALLAPARAGAQAVTFGQPQFGDRRVILSWNRAPGDTLDVKVRRACIDSLTNMSRDSVFCAWCGEQRFGGYQIWRTTSPDPESMILLRTYSVFDSTWTFIGAARAFVDPDSIIVRGCAGTIEIEYAGDVPCFPIEEGAQAPFNGFPYYYAVTAFDSRAYRISGGTRIEEWMTQDRAEGIMAEPVRPAARARTAAPLLSEVRVVPNPFNPSEQYKRSSFAGESRVRIINLPSPATVKIYTVAGDLVRSLDNSDSDDSVDWDLRNDNGDDVKGGIYMFVVSALQGAQTQSGHFVVIR